MTQKQIEQTRVIAEKDGWELKGEPIYIPPFKCYRKDIKVIPVINSQGEEFDGWAKGMPYLTDLNALHMVAMDVMEELHYHSSSVAIESALLSRPINGQYIDLFNAVYEGIVYLQNQEK